MKLDEINYIYDKLKGIDTRIVDDEHIDISEFKLKQPNYEDFNLNVEVVADIEKSIEATKSYETFYRNRISLHTLYIIPIIMIIAYFYLLEDFVIICGLFFISIFIFFILHELLLTITFKFLSPILNRKWINKLRELENSDEYINYKKYNEYHQKYCAELSRFKTFKNNYIKIEKRKIQTFWHNLNPTEFENEVAELYKLKGYKAVTTKISGDQGVDIFLEKDKNIYVVQCKKWKTKIGEHALRDLLGTKINHNANYAILVTLNGISKVALKFAEKNNIKILEIGDLCKLYMEIKSPPFIYNTEIE
ncbi:MAG: restriction endonuclease [Chlorobi bacterium]|nr:restriction endonuclease [Chlorobiota bacterium]MCI0716485.1 restriction endonuclease [Chlorobiota bacterium]